MQVVDDVSQLRNVRDFLTLYNKITEHCFQKCATNLRKSKVDDNEKSCVRGCADLYVKTNQRLTQQFMTHTPDMVKRRTEEMKEYEQKQQASPTIVKHTEQVDDTPHVDSTFK